MQQIDGGRISDSREEQNLKAASPIEVIDDGSLIDLSLSHLSKV